MSDPATDDVLDALLVLATDLARQAGTLALSMREGIEAESTKSSPTDVVTAADRAVENLLVDRIRAVRPGDGLLAEEGAEQVGTTGWRWVIDPIDGTVNYLRGIPQWATSLGVEREGVTQVGVVFDPSKNELWTAVRGRGSWLNGRRLACSTATTLSTALIGTGFGYATERRARQSLALPVLLPVIGDLRRLGAGALDLCSVAAGRLDGYYEQGLSPWDLCAGGLVATEAGARLSGLDGSPPSYDLVLAACPGIWEPLHALLSVLGADQPPQP